MDPDAEFSFVPPASPQASLDVSSPDPLSGATLYDLEVARREKLRSRGRVGTGCGEIDEAALLGGFERGSVVGVSAEDGDFGLLVGLQTAARAVVFGVAQRAAIITTLAAPVILPTLRDVIRVQVQAKLGPPPARQQQLAVVNAEVRRCLEKVSVSRVFDIEGLWEVIGELETPLAPPAVPTITTPPQETSPPAIGDDGREELSSSPLSLLGSPSPPDSPSWEHAEAAARHSPPSAQPRIEQAEVGDSEDDEDEELEFSQPPSSPPVQPPPPLPPSPALPPLRPSIASPTPAPLPPPQEPIPTEEKPVREEEIVEAKDKVTTENHIPDLILITHFSTLLTNLFTRAADNKASAHTTLQLLSSHLRYLARSSSASPLIMLLNSTNAAASASTSTSAANTTSGPIPASAPGAHTRPPLESTLRSIFNSAPPSVAGATNKRNKPAFGITFAQFLDLHLLCTRVPRTRKDAETPFAPPPGGAAREVRYGWVVEVLLDELGVWGESKNDVTDVSGGKGKGEETDEEVQNKVPERRRINREQRWGAVDVRGGVLLVDLFPGTRQQQPQVAKGPVRFAAGFGGPPSRGM